MVIAVSFNKRIPPSATASSRGTLAELMARQKAAADMKNSYTAEAQSPTIMQGLGNMANIGLNAFKEGRAGADLDIQQQRQRELMGQIDPATGATEQQIAAMGEFDPKMMADLWSDRSAKLRRDAERDNWQPLTQQEYAELGVDPAVDGPYTRNITTGEYKPLKGSSGVNINTGDNKVETEWGKVLAKQFGEQLIADAGAGSAAKTRAGQLDLLDMTADKMVTGVPGVIANFAKQYGFQLGEGADQTALFASVIDGMAPKERVAGSGSMSNYDIQTLKNSLPNFTNSVEGIHRLTGYLRGMNDYNAKLALIAQETSGIGDPAEARKYYYEKANALPNPLEGFMKDQKAAADAAKANPPAPVADPANPNAPVAPEAGDDLDAINAELERLKKIRDAGGAQ